MMGPGFVQRALLGSHNLEWATWDQVPQLTLFWLAKMGSDEVLKLITLVSPGGQLALQIMICLL